MAVSGDRTEGSGIQNTPLRCAVGRWATLGLPAAPGRTQTSAAAPLASSVVVGVGRIKRVATAAAGLGRVVMLWRRDQGAAGTASAVAGDQALQLRLRPAAPNPVGLSSTDRVGQAGALGRTDPAHGEGVVLVLGVIGEERVVIGGHDLAAQC